MKQVKEGKTRDNNNFVCKAGSIREHVRMSNLIIGFNGTEPDFLPVTMNQFFRIEMKIYVKYQRESYSQSDSANSDSRN